MLEISVEKKKFLWWTNDNEKDERAALSTQTRPLFLWSRNDRTLTMIFSRFPPFVPVNTPRSPAPRRTSAVPTVVPAAPDVSRTASFVLS